tara:strand:+ start:442 stop:1068 length:627 start_codon:yes stop_codon:yes gene_type:complete
MTITNAYDRQPTKFDYASPTQFKFQLAKLPKVEYFTTACNIPGISLGTTLQPTPLTDISLPGDTLTFGDLEITFLVDENLENYREIHGWMYGIGFPKARTQFAELVSTNKDRFPTTGKDSGVTDAGKVKYGAVPSGPIFSDATLNVLSSKNNTVIEVRFSDVFPTSLSGLNFNQQADDVNYLSATVSFKYKMYEFALKNASNTTNTVT